MGPKANFWAPGGIDLPESKEIYPDVLGIARRRNAHPAAPCALNGLNLNAIVAAIFCIPTRSFLLHG